MEPEFYLRPIIRPGSKDDSWARYRLVTSYEAKRHWLKILDLGLWTNIPDDNRTLEETDKVRLKNGYFTRDGVYASYEEQIGKQLVTLNSYSNPTGQVDQLTKEDWCVAMTYACENDDLREVESIVRGAGPDILRARLPQKYKGTVLHVCALFDSTEVLGRLLEMEGVDPAALDSYSENHLHSAAYTGSVGAAKLILATEGSRRMLNAQNCYSNTPLVHSVRYRHPEVCKLLLGTAGIQPDLAGEKGNTPLHVAVTHARSWEMVDMILSHPIAAETKLVDKCNAGDLETPLHCAVRTLQAEICSRLLQAGASLTAKDKNNKTPLQLASETPQLLPEFRRWCNLERLLPVCADNKRLVNWEFADGLTPLHVAAAHSNAVAYVEDLIRHGAWLDHKNADGDTCLHVAVKRSNVEVFKCLLKLLKEPRYCAFKAAAMTPQKWLSMRNGLTRESALHIAIEQSNEEMALGLINKRGAFVDVQNRLGETPLHIAARKGSLKVVRTLLSRDLCALSPARFAHGEWNWNAWVTMCSSAGETVLHEAVRAGNEEVVQEILQFYDAAHIDQLLKLRDLEDRTALYWALRLSQPEKAVSMCTKLMVGAKAAITRAFLLMWELRSSSYDLSTQQLLAAVNEEIERRGLSILDNKSLLKEATKSRDSEMVKLLVYQGADVAALELDEDAHTWLCEIFYEIASDRPATRDTLDRKQLVDGIAALLLSPFTATPITIGILGEWGTGKSSVMLQVQESLLEMSAYYQTLRQQQVINLDKDSSSDAKAIRNLSFDKKTIPYGRREHHQSFKDLALGSQSTHIPYRREHHLSFKDLSLGSQSTRVDKSSSRANLTKKVDLKQAAKLGEIPYILNVNYNAWHYQDKAEASAGLAIEISKEIENAMSRPQRLRMCAIYSWQSKRSDIFLNLLLPLLIFAIAIPALVILWKVAAFKTIYKAISLPATFLAALLFLFKSWSNVLVPVAEKISSYVQTPDHKPTLGYQHKVIQDIQFLKEQLCTPPSLPWRILGWSVIHSVQKCMKGSQVRRQHAPASMDNLRIVVYIDDLDRCQQPIILELLCVINFILAQCKINVVLGIEESMVHRAVTQAFLKDSNDPKVAKAFADKYLQKFIQLPIQLTNPGRQELVRFLEGQIGSNQNIKVQRRKNDNQSVNVRENEESNGNVDNEESLCSHDLSDGEQLIIPISNSDNDDLNGNGKRVARVDTDARDGNSTKASISAGSIAMRHSTAPTAIPLFLETYTQSELQMLHNLVPKVQCGDRKLPREWKRFLNYHRLASNILLQDQLMRRDKLKAWRTKLILWIFISWNWTEEMNIIIKKWDDLIDRIQKERGRKAQERSAPELLKNEETPPTDSFEHFVASCILQTREKAVVEVKPDITNEHAIDIGNSLCMGDVIDVYISQELPQAIGSKVNKRKEKKEKSKEVNWQEFYKCLKEHDDLSMDYVDAFQQFRFYCELDHLNIPRRNTN